MVKRVDIPNNELIFIAIIMAGKSRVMIKSC